MSWLARDARCSCDIPANIGMLQQILVGGPRRRIPPRLLIDARTLLRSVVAAAEWEPWKRQLLDQYERPASRTAASGDVSR